MLRRHAGGAVGDLLAEVVALSELFPHDADYVVGVAVVFGEDDGLGNLGAAGEYLGEQPVPEGLDYGEDLVYGHNVPVKLVGRIGEVFIKLLPPHIPRAPVPAINVMLRFDGGTFLGDLGADAVDVGIHVDAIGHRLLVGVLHHQVLLEEPEGLRRWRRRKTDEEGVEISGTCRHRL